MCCKSRYTSRAKAKAATRAELEGLRDILRPDREVPDNKNKMFLLILISLILKTFKLMIILMNIGYFTGMIWMIGCIYLHKFRSETDTLDGFMEAHHYFAHLYKLSEKPIEDQAIIGFYFAFTTLSTVGFGDFTPWSDGERLCGSMMLLLGVAIFSYYMTLFISMLEKIKEFQSDVDDGDQLAKFFGLISKFNNNTPVNLELKRKIEAHMAYKWQNDKTIFLKTTEDLALVSQIPTDCSDKIFYEYLHSQFLKDFRKYFIFEKKSTLIQYNFYNWQD